VSIHWDLEPLPNGVYTISANASVLPGETDTADNFFVNGDVLKTIFADVTGDADVLMVHNTNDIQGFWSSGAGWSWYFSNGALTAGTVPAARITAGTFGGSTAYTFPQDLTVTGNLGIGASASYALDISGSGDGVGIEFDDGDAFITTHDGFGNFNIKSGVDDDNVIVSGTGGSHIRMDETGYIHLWIDETTAETGTFSMDSGITINNGDVTITLG